MTYLKVSWNHSKPTYPVVFYSELDENRWEVRKVEVFANGRYKRAGANNPNNMNELGEVPTPTLEQIASDAQFSPLEITKEQFQLMWEMCDM